MPLLFVAGTKTLVLLVLFISPFCMWMAALHLCPGRIQTGSRLICILVSDKRSAVMCACFFSPPYMEILKEAGTLRRMLPSDLQDIRISVAIVMKRGGVKKKKKKKRCCYCDF